MKKILLTIYFIVSLILIEIKFDLVSLKRTQKIEH